jgi:hypothetical protein
MVLTVRHFAHVKDDPHRFDARNHGPSLKHCRYENIDVQSRPYNFSYIHTSNTISLKSDRRNAHEELTAPLTHNFLLIRCNIV